MRIPLTVLSLAAVALVLGACGENQYDAGKVESILKEGQQGKLGGLAMGEATCPKDVKLTEGVTFQCTLVIAGERAPYKVTLTNVKADKVTVTAEPAKALVSTKAVLDYVRSQLTPELRSKPLTCGDKQILIAEPGTKIGCVITIDGKENQIVLRVKDTKGTVVLERN